MTSPTQSEARFRNRTELLDFLLEVAEATTETLDLEALMDNLASVVREVVPYDLFAILLHSEQQDGLRVRYSIGHRRELTKSLVIPLDEGITGAAATSLEPVLVGDVRSDPRYLPTVDAVRTELAVPMVARGRLVGVIDLQSTRPDAYSDEDSSLVRLIASRVAVSIDNARLYRRVVRQNHTSRTLATLAQEFSATLDLDILLDKIATTVKKLINFDAFSLLLVDEDQKLLRTRFSLRCDQRVELDNVPLGKGITGAAVESRETIVVEDTRSDARYIESTSGIQSEVAVPLLVPNRVLGVMDLESERVGYFTEEHVRLLSLLAPLIANSVENARLYEDVAERQRRSEANLRAARHLQSALLLREPPPVRGLEVAVRARPAQEVSGDLYDFFQQGEELDIIAFGDVSGKGAGAAIYGALVGGLLRTLAPRRSGSGVLMQSLNAALGERKIHATYVTLLILFWEASKRRFRMANAGVFPPIICRGGQILKQRVEGIPIGLLDDIQYDENVFDAEPGDIIMLYSDGIFDQVNSAGEEFGRRPLYQCLEARWRESPSEIVDAVFEELDQFRAGAELSDDQTVIILKVN
ncbi:MAG: GAF domain-containing protein [bacterium]|nr:GAF domain-containing protein [bacterium]